MINWFVSLTGKFMMYTGVILFALISVIYSIEWYTVGKDAEAQLLDKGNSMAISMSKSLQAITEDDILKGVVLKDGTRLTGEEVKKRLFDDKLQLVKESEAEAQKRLSLASYAEQTQTLFDGRTIPSSKYELK